MLKPEPVPLRDLILLKGTSLPEGISPDTLYEPAPHTEAHDKTTAVIALCFGMHCRYRPVVT